jgi:hypothetical protein
MPDSTGRLGDLDPAYLRYPEARGMIQLAERLYQETDRKIPPSRSYFKQLWPIVGRLLASARTDHDQTWLQTEANGHP